MDPWETAAAGLLGGLASFFLGLILPFVGPLLGGVFAGYQHESGGRAGLVAGVVAGVTALLIAAVPVALVVPLLVGEGAGPLVAVLTLALVFGVLGVYYVGLGALGGYLGGALAARDETTVGRTPFL